MVYQLIMGHFYCESLKAKASGDEGKAKKMSVCTLLVPIIIHGFNDLGCHMIEFEGFKTNETVQMIVTIASVVFLLVLQVVTLIVAIRLSKKDQDLGLELQENNKK